MAKVFVPVNGQVVRWAIEESGLSTEDVARKVRVDVATLEEWVGGVAQPSQGEFTRLFKALRRPSALFFAPRAPEPSRIPSLRRAPGETRPALSEGERLWIRRSRRLQKLMSFLAQQSGRRVTLPRFVLEEGVEAAGERMRRWLDVSVDLQMSWDSSDDPWRWWRERLERRGILVFALQLGPDGIRGFSLRDEVAPVIAVNTVYNREARIYTAFHELGHLTLRSESLCSDVGFAEPSQQDKAVVDEERWCEEFAAAVLLPRSAVFQFMDSVGADRDGFDLAKELAAKFGVSLRAAAIRLIRLEVVPRSLYAQVDKNARSWDRDKGFARGRPTYRPERRLSEYGAVVDELIRSSDQGLLNLRDLTDYLRVDTTEVDELSRLVGIGG